MLYFYWFLHITTYIQCFTSCLRLIQPQGTNQSSATVQTVNQDENQQQLYSSLLHGQLTLLSSYYIYYNNSIPCAADLPLLNQINDYGINIFSGL